MERLKLASSLFRIFCTIGKTSKGLVPFPVFYSYKLGFANQLEKRVRETAVFETYLMPQIYQYDYIDLGGKL